MPLDAGPVDAGPVDAGPVDAGRATEIPVEIAEAAALEDVPVEHADGSVEPADVSVKPADIVEPVPAVEPTSPTEADATTPVVAAQLPAPSVPVPVDQLAAAAPASRPQMGPVLLALGLGSLVAVGMGLFGRFHEPTGTALNLAGFSSGLAVKAWLTTVAMALGIAQILTGLGMFGRLPLRGRWVAPLHRWSGRIAVLLTVPIAVHCLYALGFQGYSVRVLVHSLLGCFFFGAFVAKMLVLTREDAPGWVLPVAGGSLFTALTGLWLTAGLWFFTTFGLIR